MPNFNAVFKQEVARLARKEIRAETEVTRRAAARHRGEIAALKRQVAGLERQIKALESGRRQRATIKTVDGDQQKPRFSPKWVFSDRQRLGLSAKHYGQLIGVTGLTVYNWEKGRSKPRDKQLASWATVRGMGKREALARLAELNE